MKRSLCLQAAAAVLFAAACAYLGAGIFSPLISEVTCVPVPCKYIRTLPLSGIALRRESVLADGVSLPDPSIGAVRLPADQLPGSDAAQRGSALLLFGTDGLEYLAPPADEILMEEDFSRYLSAVPRTQDADAPRLVHGFYWYYAAYCPDTTDVVLSPGSYWLSFPGASRQVTAQLLPAAAGKQLLLFRIPLGDPVFLSLRRCEATLCFAPVSAFSLPSSALASGKPSHIILQTEEDPVSIPVSVLFQDKDRCLIQAQNVQDLPAGSRVLVDADKFMEERNEYTR